MLRSNRLGTRAVLAMALLLAGCDVTRVGPDREMDAAMRGDAAFAQRDAGADAATAPSPDAGAADTGVPSPTLPPFGPLPDSICSLEVGAECDGREDCAGGQTCCGVFDPLGFTYRQIRCMDSCEDTNEIELCHPGEACSRPGHVCRRSFILPYEFLSVCADPGLVSPNATGQALAGEIACGPESCQVGSEQCCLRTRYEFAARTLRALEPYCAPLDHACDCDHALPPSDAGVDGGADQDAGAD